MPASERFNTARAIAADFGNNGCLGCSNPFGLAVCIHFSE